MGAIRTIKNVSQDGSESAITALEITYGGKESPFGGVHTGPPPAYIEPSCFADSANMLVVDNKLVAISWVPFALPTLWGGTSGVVLLKVGTFYNSTYGQLNYALGFSSVPIITNPKKTKFTFFMTSWNYVAGVPTVVDNSFINIALYNSVTPATQASITLPAILSNVGNTTAATTPAVVSNIVRDYPDGSLLTVNLSSGGTGYVAGQSLTVYQGTNQTGSIVIDTVSGAGAILTQHVDNPGYGYEIPGGSHGPVTLTANPETPSMTELKIVGPGGTHTYSVNSFSNSSLGSVVAAMVTAINAGPDPNVTAQASLDGLSIKLSANPTNAPGATGNTVTVQDLSVNSNAALAPPVYFPCLIADYLAGGADATVAIVTQNFRNISVTDVGGTIYIANIGPYILKYSGPNSFAISSGYTGVVVIKKFAGSLIGIGVIPALGTVLQDSDMIFAWSAANNLDEWSPVDANGLVTGAGFAQLADISEPLTGLIVTNNVAYIIRARGISYASALGSGTNPFQFAHVGLGHTGEGSQNAALIGEYDQTGAYVGSTDVFQVSGSLSSIGEKIKSALIPFLGQNVLLAKTVVFPCLEGGDSYPLVAIIFDGTIFLYNTNNQTWMISKVTIPGGVTYAVADILFKNTNSSNNIFPAVIVLQSGTEQPVAYQIQEGVNNSTSLSSTQSTTFPQEEVLFGRDVTVDSLYVALWGNVSANTTINFLINGVVFSSFVLTAAAFNTLNGQPTEIQLFPTGNTLLGLKTARSPQLSYTITGVGAGTAQIRISKIQMYASFDPMQRPV